MSVAESYILQHEANKKYLKTLDFRYDDVDTFSSNSTVNVLDREKDDVLIEFIKGTRDNYTIYKYVRVRDTSTGKLVLLSVPPSMTRCREAIAWTFGIPLSEYELLFET